MKKIPFKIDQIGRYDLPSYERQGSVVQILSTDKMVIVTFCQTKNDIETEFGLPVMGLEKDLYLVNPGRGIENTVVVGCIGFEDSIDMIDISMLGGKSVSNKSWENRLEMLKLLHDGFSEKGRQLFRLASQHKHGFLKLSKDGFRVLVRIPGKQKAALCVGI